MTMDVGTERLVLAVQELALAKSVEDIQRIVRTAARHIAGADGATLVLRDVDQCHYVDEDAIAPLWKGQRFPLTACISGWAMLNREPAIISDIYKDDRIPLEAYRPTFVKSLVMTPIRTLDPIGAIGAYWATERTPTEAEVGLLKALADSTAVAFENVTIQRQLAQHQDHEDQMLRDAMTDELTGLPNRRGFRLLGDHKIAQLGRDAQDAYVLFIDVNALKAVNDTLGHAAGDELLRRMATAMRHVFRDGDVLARLGGDEFAAFVSGVSVKPEQLSVRLRAEMAHLSADVPGSPSLTAAIGSAEYQPGASLDELVALADAAMYVDKIASATTAVKVQ